MSSIVVRIGANTKKFNEGLDKVKGQTRALESNLAKIGKISAVAFAGAGAAIAGAVAQAGKFERINTQFEVLTGSVETANKTIKELSDFSARTPFEFESIANAGKTLLSFGFEAGEVRQRLQEIGDVAAVTGKDVGELSVIFGQIAAQGKLTGERLNQLQEAGVPIGPALANTLGIAESSLRDFVSQGKVSAEQFQVAFRSLSQEGGVAFQGLEKVSNTLEGQISTLKDNFLLFAADIGKQFLPIVKTATVALTEFFQFIRENEDLAKFAAIILASTTALGGLATALTAAGVAFLKFRAIMLATNGSLLVLTNSFRLLAGATGIGLVLVGLDLLFRNWQAIFPRLKIVADNVLAGLIESFKGFEKLLAGVFTLDIEKIKQGFAEIKDAAVNGYKGIQEDLQTFREENPPPVPGVPTPEEQEIATQSMLEANEERRAALEEQRIANEEIDKEREAEEKAKRDEQRALEIEQLKAALERQLQIAREGAAGLDSTEERRRKDFLKKEKKFGTVVAKLDQITTSEQVKRAEKASASLIQLQQSKNNTLKSIGKAAALTQIGIDTARGAIGAYQALAAIPIVGPALGAVAAAAVVAYGAEQTASVLSAQTGGLVPGSTAIPDRDTVPAILSPGEFVVPRNTAEEVINAAADRRLRQRDGASEGGLTQVQISVEGEGAEEFITVRQNESRFLGTSKEA